MPKKWQIKNQSVIHYNFEKYVMVYQQSHMCYDVHLFMYLVRVHV